MFQNLKTRLDPKGLLTAASPTETPPERRTNPPASPSKRKPASAQNLENASKDVVLQEYYALQNQLARYQQRLSDVVQAYKALQKEKQTLEQSLHALSSAAPSDTASQISETDQAENGDREDSADVQSLQQRLSTLAAALSAVTKEKAGKILWLIGEEEWAKTQRYAHSSAGLLSRGQEADAAATQGNPTGMRPLVSYTALQHLTNGLAQ